MKVAMITVGNPERRTGGYLYHKQVYANLARMGLRIDEIVVSDADEAAQQQATIPADITAYDVIMVDMLARIAVAPYVAQWQSQTTIVAMVHELPSLAGISVTTPEQILLDAAHRCIVVSEAGAAALVARGVSASRLVLAKPGCDRLGAPALQRAVANPAVLCVAQWIPRKGIDALLRAWAMVGARHVPLAFYGEVNADPRYAAGCRQQVLELQQAGYAISVRGSVSNRALRAGYAAARVFVLPSRFEGYGMAHAEAIWAGIPVVGYAIPSVQRIVAAAGALVPIDDEAALAQALAPYCSDATHGRTLHDAIAHARAELPRWQDTAFAWLAALDASTQPPTIPAPYAYRTG